MSKPISVVFEGEESDAVRAFDRVGDASRNMSSKIDQSEQANRRLGKSIGDNEGKFMGTADLLDGLGGAFGLPTEGATKMFRAFGDLSGGFEVVSGILPSLSAMFPKMATAMTFISAHPLIIGILAGGAIIAGLVFLEKKFGLVSGAVDALGGAFKASWENGIRPTLNFIIDGIELYLKAMAMPFTLLNKVPGVKSLIPDGLTDIKLPRLDVGGTVLQTGIAVVHRGEVVSPAVGPSSFGGGRGDVHFHIEGSVITERDLMRMVRDGLAREDRL